MAKVAPRRKRVGGILPHLLLIGKLIQSFPGWLMEVVNRIGKGLRMELKEAVIEAACRVAGDLWYRSAKQHHSKECLCNYCELWKSVKALRPGVFPSDSAPTKPE